MVGIDRKYIQDDEFKAAARLHQSQFRENELKVGYNGHKNILTDTDAEAKLNYYDGLNVTKALCKRYGKKPSLTRDANMLRSEHIPFNMLAPLRTSPLVAKRIIKNAFGLESDAPYKIKIEFAPKPKQEHLNDATSFDTFIRYTDRLGKKIGLGIEVKYTRKDILLVKQKDRMSKIKSHLTGRSPGILLFFLMTIIPNYIKMSLGSYGETISLACLCAN